MGPARREKGRNRVARGNVPLLPRCAFIAAPAMPPRHHGIDGKQADRDQYAATNPAGKSAPTRITRRSLPRRAQGQAQGPRRHIENVVESLMRKDLPWRSGQRLPAIRCNQASVDTPICIIHQLRRIDSTCSFLPYVVILRNRTKIIAAGRIRRGRSYGFLI